MDNMSTRRVSGLRDKNGTMILDGSVLKISNNNKFKEIFVVARYGEYKDANSAFEDDRHLGWYVEHGGECTTILVGSGNGHSLVDYAEVVWDEADGDMAELG